MYNKPVCFTWLTLCLAECRSGLGLHLAFWPHELPMCNGGSRCHECMGLEGKDPTQANTKIGQKKRASNLTERASAVGKHHVPFSPPSQFGVCLCGHQARDAPAPWGSGRLPFFFFLSHRASRGVAYYIVHARQKGDQQARAAYTRTSKQQDALCSRVRSTVVYHRRATAWLVGMAQGRAGW